MQSNLKIANYVDLDRPTLNRIPSRTQNFSNFDLSSPCFTAKIDEEMKSKDEIQVEMSPNSVAVAASDTITRYILSIIAFTSIIE